MKKLVKLVAIFFTSALFAQAGHVMQGVGSVNMSMGGAATAQPIDIDGALQWNPAAISVFNKKILSFDLGLFFSSPELSSSLPANMMGPGSPAISGTTKDNRGVSPMPALAMVWGKEGSKATFGLSAFGISGFGVTFPEETNVPILSTGAQNANWDPTSSNPINFPQNLGGFGLLKSDYMLLQVAGTFAYEITKNLSIGLQPAFNYSTLQLSPNPIASPNPQKGYPTSNKATATGFSGQVGLFYHSDGGIKIGASYKTAVKFGDFNFKNTYIDGTVAPDASFRMDYPAIASIGFGYSNENFDYAVDFRQVDYEHTAGFEAKGWTQTGSVQGFGWKNVNILSAGIQYKGIAKLPLRIGYTYSSNPISSELAFFSSPATAVVKNALQFGFGYHFNDNFTLNGVYHHGMSNGKTEGPLLNPMMASASNPYGAIPNSSVSYTMNTDLLMVGISYTFSK